MNVSSDSIKNEEMMKTLSINNGFRSNSPSPANSPISTATILTDGTLVWPILSAQSQFPQNSTGMESISNGEGMVGNGDGGGVGVGSGGGEGLELPSCAKYLRPFQIQNVPDDYQQLFGLDDCKTMLRHCIYNPMRAPRHRTMCGGMVSVPYNLYMYGPDGMGKATLVRSFCKTMGYSLIWVKQMNVDPDSKYDLIGIYAFAVQMRQQLNEPIIILFQDCTDLLQQGHKQYQFRLFQDQLLENVFHNHRIWTIFTGNLIPREALHQDLSVYITRMCLAPTLGDAQRKHFLYTLLANCVDIEVVPEELRNCLSNHLKILSDASKGYTVAEIRWFVSECLDKVLNEIPGDEQDNIAPRSLLLLPNWSEKIGTYFYSLNSPTGCQISEKDPTPRAVYFDDHNGIREANNVALNVEYYGGVSNNLLSNEYGSYYFGGGHNNFNGKNNQDMPPS